MRPTERIDPQSRAALQDLLDEYPGGYNAITDIPARRQAVLERYRRLTAGLPANDAVVMQEYVAPGQPDVQVRVYSPADVASPPLLPGILFIHGGGMVMGGLEPAEPWAQLLCERVGAIVVSTDYRKAPEHPHPAQMDDCYTALTWMKEQAPALGIDPDRLAVFGGSAGGNLCLAVALRARDAAGPRLAMIMPVYPMLDDRHVAPSTFEILDVGVWDRDASIEAWTHFLGGAPADHYAAPARADDLTGLPPTFIDIGAIDLFRDEVIEFVARLSQAEVPVAFHLYPDAFHASEMYAPKADLSQRIWDVRIDALQRGLGLA